MLDLTKNTYMGKLIVFEGTDGAGKTTMIDLTIDYLAKKYGRDNIVLTKQPTDISRKTKLFQKMMYSSRSDDINYRAVQLLTLSDRVQHNYEVIIPALMDGKIVVCDRYLYTSIANMIARGYKDETWFFDACKEIIRPDIVFLAYVSPKLAITRIKSRKEERNRYLNETLLKEVANQFLNLKETEGFIQVKTELKPMDAFKRVREHLDQMWEERR